MAVKIKTAETPVNTLELAILAYLKQQGNLDPMSKHVIALLHHFEHQGPNRKQVCIVSKALSANISNVLKTCSKYSHGPLMFFPKLMVKRIFRQVLMDICFLHSYGIIHGDLHLDNILFAAPSPDSSIVKELEYDKTLEDFVIIRLNATFDKSTPRYIAVTLPLIKHFCNVPNFTVKIYNLGGNKFTSNTNTYTCLTQI